VRGLKANAHMRFPKHVGLASSETVAARTKRSTPATGVRVPARRRRLAGIEGTGRDGKHAAGMVVQLNAHPRVTLPPFQGRHFLRPIGVI